MIISCVAILQYEEDGIFVHFPDLPICNTCGFSYEEAVQMAKEVLELGLHGVRIGDLPKFRHRADFALSPQQEAVEITAEMNVEHGVLTSPEVIPVPFCRLPDAYEFINPTSKIAEISIVRLSFNETNELIQTEITKIVDAATFLEDFRRVECYVFFGDPIAVTPEGTDATAIKIVYQNGEYELINHCGQSEHTAEIGFSFYAGCSSFDQKQFEELIKKYLPNSGTDFEDENGSHTQCLYKS